MKNPHALLLLLLGGLVPPTALGCTVSGLEARAEASPGLASTAAGRGAYLSDAEAAPQPDAQPVAGDRLMIYSARFDVLVSNVEDSLKRFVGWVEEQGGYLESRADATVTCRIPAVHFNELVERVPTLGTVLSESLRAEDVTLQSIDLTVRIENAEKSRQRLLALLEQATDMEATLQIEKELRRLTVELERMKAELKLLESRIAFSTVTVTFKPNAPEPRSTARRAQSRFPWVRQVGIEYVLDNF